MTITFNKICGLKAGWNDITIVVVENEKQVIGKSNNSTETSCPDTIWWDHKGIEGCFHLINSYSGEGST